MKKQRRQQTRRELAVEVLGQVRGGLDSGPSDANRIIERHERPGNQGRASNLVLEG